MERKEKAYSCPESDCDCSYTIKSNLLRHQRSKHGKESKGRFTCEVPACMKSFFHASKLVQHYKEDHDMEMGSDNKTFPNWEAFRSWKESEEESSHSYFPQVKGIVTSATKQDCKIILYACCRDGTKRENKGPTKSDQKRVHTKGSRKLDGSYCLARMYVTQKEITGEIEVVYNFTHTNHTLGPEECKYIPLPFSVRKTIERKFAQGITLERIINDIREEVGGRHKRGKFDEDVKRKHFITRQDCCNSSRKVRNFKNHRHDNDAISVNRIVSELQLENPSPILVYTPPGNLFLVIMTEFQANLFAQFSYLVCVDSTHKTNEYGYKLITLMVIDEFRNGQPVAWAICDTETKDTYTEFFKAIKRRVPEATISVLMTDDDSAICGACSNVFPGVTHLLCRWHVDRAWQKKLHDVVKDKQHKAEIYKFLLLLMTEEDTTVLNTNIDLFLDFWEPQQPKFVAYFRQFYTNRVEKWALAHRHFDHKDTDTNNFVESFHNKLKSNPRYLNHHVNRRCDDLIEVLLSMEVDMFFTRKRKEFMSSVTEASAKMEGDRHKASLDIATSRVSTEECQYLVQSSDQKRKYNVKLLSMDCEENANCLPQCTQKECVYLCRHMIACDCYDYQHGHLCKHCHRVHQLYFSPSCGSEELQEQQAASDEDFEEIGVTSRRICADFQGKRSMINGSLSDISSCIDLVSDVGILDHVHAQLVPIIASLEAHLHEIPQEQQQSNFTVLKKFAPAQKNERQLNFHRTQTSGSKAQSVFRYPSQEEQQVLRKKLEQQKECNSATSSSSSGTAVAKKGYKRKRCGSCSGCRSGNCGKCQFCMDMPQFGGKGRKKKCCEMRRCLNFKDQFIAADSNNPCEAITALGGGEQPNEEQTLTRGNIADEAIGETRTWEHADEATASDID